MKGLLMKDLMFIKNQKVFLFVLAGLCIYFLISGQETSFVLAYASSMFATLVISTVSYDEQDNGMSYLFTFPISRNMYVMEKYVFGILMSGAAVLVGGCFMLALAVVKSLPYSPEEILTLMSASLLVPVFLISFLMPIVIKFGTEKSRAVFLLTFGGLLLVCYSVKQIADAFGVDIWARVEQFVQADTTVAVAVIVALAAGIFAASYGISVGIMRRKQF